MSGAAGGAGQTRSFDFERRLRQVVAGSTTTTYIYDGAGLAAGRAGALQLGEGGAWSRPPGALEENH